LDLYPEQNKIEKYCAAFSTTYRVSHHFGDEFAAAAAWDKTYA